MGLGGNTPIGELVVPPQEDWGGFWKYSADKQLMSPKEGGRNQKGKGKGKNAPDSNDPVEFGYRATF